MSTPSPALGNRTPEQLKVAELREELKKRGIQIKGLKKDLVDRLEEVLKQEELEQQKTLETIVEDAAATPVDQAEPVTPVTKRRSKAHDHHAKEEEPKEDTAISDGHVLASEGSDITVSVPEAAPAENVTAATPVEETTAVAAGNGEEVPAVESAKAVDEQATTSTAVPALEDLVADLEQNFSQALQEEEPQVQQAGGEETHVGGEETRVGGEETQAGREETMAGKTLESIDIVPAVEKDVDENMALTEEFVSTTFEKTVTTMVEEQEVSVVPEDQNVAIVEEEQTVTTSIRIETIEDSANEVAIKEETTITVVTVETSTKVGDGEGLKPDTEAVGLLEVNSDEQMEEAPKENATEVVTIAETSKDAIVMEEAPKEDTTEVVTIAETSKDAIVMEGAPKEDGTEVVTIAETSKDAIVMEEVPKEDATEVVTIVETSKDAIVMEEAPKEDASEVVTIVETSKDAIVMEEAPEEDFTEVVTIAETPKDAMVMEGTEKGAANVEESKGETPMDVDADTQKGSKRKDGVDGELTTLEPTKRRRWNSAKGEEDSKISGKGVQSLELQEPVPSSNALVPSAKVLTPKSAPPEKVALTRTAPTRTEAAVNGEGQKTRVVPPSAKPATSSLKIDKFLRPFTFKAVKELLAQTGTVQDVWMDQIKTHCYVTYSSVEEATATRNALFNLQWPPQGGRLLTAEFVDPSEVKLRSDGEKAAATATATAAPSTNSITPRGALSTNSKPSKDGSAVPLSGLPSTPGVGLLPPPPPLPFSPRDRPKQEVERTPTLDDLFRKTRSKPHIYYLPLTAQEVADKVAARNREAATKPGVKA